MVRMCGLILLCTTAWAWQANIDGTANGNDQVNAVAVDGAGNVLAAGGTANTGTGFDFTVIKFDPNGAELWRQVINGTANGGDEANAVAVDPNGDVVVAGFTTNTLTGRDFTVIKFSGADGTEQWRQEMVGSFSFLDQANAVTVDANGDVVAAGNTGTLVDFAVIKFSGIDGTELWHQEIAGTAFGNDTALAVAVDAQGDVLAAGRTANTGTGQDFTVVKLRGTDGSDF
ncbi:MAG: hypothetical protein ACREQA_14785 [Candidatus Binatia bacterium]